MGSEILGPLAFAKRGSSLLPFSVSSSQPGTLAQCHERKDTLNPQDIFLTKIGNEKELLLGMPKNTVLEYPKLWPWKNGEREIINHWFLRYPILGKTDMIQNISAVL